MKKFLSGLVIVLLVFAAGVVAARIAFPLPDLGGREETSAVELAPDTAWGAAAANVASLHEGKSGVLPLADGTQALASRLRLIAGAQTAIDVQYYIWRDDTSGRMMFKALYDAAERGVRVRLLLDDIGIAGLDNTLAALDRVENIDIRLFNPSTIRNPKAASYVFDFFRMNRRMHNKALIVDGAAAIIGGRNIGDEYFSIGNADYFLDLDVLAVGAIVPPTEANFDDYWNSGSSYPIDLILADNTAPLPTWLSGPLPAPEAEWIRTMPGPDDSTAGRLAAGQAQLEWTDVTLLSDHPSKGLGKASGEQLMINQLLSVVGEIRDSLDVISAYFIPGDRGLDYFTGVQKAGAQVTVLTNALTTTDVAIVHSGYSKYRDNLLRAGIVLYELKPPDQPEDSGARAGSGPGSSGSSGSSLHAKTVAVDDKRIFIGSFNFDPRSVNLNCEMGFLIESSDLAGRVGEAFKDRIAALSYRVVLDEDDDLRWIETGEDGQEIVHETEPHASFLDRAVMAVLSNMPIEWLL